MPDDRDARIAELEAENAALRVQADRSYAERDEAREHQAATSDILRIVAAAPTDLQVVFNAIAENAARLLGADNVRIHQTDGGAYLRIVAGHGHLGDSGSFPRRGPHIDRDSPPGRAILDRRTIHVEDMVAAVETEYPATKQTRERDGVRVLLVTRCCAKACRSATS